MDWKIVLIPVIAMVVAVLASVFRGAEEARRRSNQRAGTGPEPRPERPRTDSSGIDQFLEEIRRRQASRQESARTTQREIRSPREEARPESPTPPVAPPPPPPRRRESPVLAVAVDAPSMPAVLVAEIPIARPAPSAAPAVVVPQRESPLTGAIRTQLTALLKTKPGLRTAFVLREIFDAPMCRRRH